MLICFTPRTRFSYTARSALVMAGRAPASSPRHPSQRWFYSVPVGRGSRGRPFDQTRVGGHDTSYQIVHTTLHGNIHREHLSNESISLPRKDRTLDETLALLNSLSKLGPLLQFAGPLRSDEVLVVNHRALLDREGKRPRPLDDQSPLVQQHG